MPFVMNVHLYGPNLFDYATMPIIEKPHGYVWKDVPRLSAGRYYLPAQAMCGVTKEQSGWKAGEIQIGFHPSGVYGHGWFGQFWLSSVPPEGMYIFQVGQLIIILKE